MCYLKILTFLVFCALVFRPLRKTFITPFPAFAAAMIVGMYAGGYAAAWLLANSRMPAPRIAIPISMIWVGLAAGYAFHDWVQRMKR